MAELKNLILTIIKANKSFPQTYRSVGGLLQQYIYWLNIGRTGPFSEEFDLATVKATAHDLIKLYHTDSFISATDLYDEALLNSISKSIDKKDFDSAKNIMTELDTACAILIISEREFSFVMHKNRAGASAPTRFIQYFILVYPNY